MKLPIQGSCVLAAIVAPFLTPPAASAGGNVPYLVKDIKPGWEGASPSFPSRVGNRLFFNADDGVHGQELWISDCTEQGTYMVIDLVSGSDGSVPQWWMEDLNGTAVYYADNNQDGFDMYRSDGTANGTVRLGDVNSGDDPIPDGSCTFSLYKIKETDGTVFFEGKNAANVPALWKTDGTPQGTVKLKDVEVNQMEQAGSVLFFAGAAGGQTIPGYDIWKSDGTSNGTVKLRDLGGAIWLTESNGLVFFNGEDPQADNELWVSNGTPQGTVRVKDINPGPNPSTPVNLTDVNGTLYFTAFSPAFGREIWRSDGTEAGTELLIDLVPGSGNSGAYELTNVDGILFFGRFDTTQGWQLWKSDGSAAGTELVKVIGPPTLSSKNQPSAFVAANGKLYFSGDDGVHGEEVWVSNGFNWGTFMLDDTNPGSEGMYPGDFEAVGPILFLTGGIPGVGQELWALDTRDPIVPTLSPCALAIFVVLLVCAGVVVILRTRKINECTHVSGGSE